MPSKYAESSGDKPPFITQLAAKDSAGRRSVKEARRTRLASVRNFIKLVYYAGESVRIVSEGVDESFELRKVVNKAVRIFVFLFAQLYVRVVGTVSFWWSEIASNLVRGKIFHVSDAQIFWKILEEVIFPFRVESEVFENVGHVLFHVLLVIAFARCASWRVLTFQIQYRGRKGIHLHADMGHFG